MGQVGWFRSLYSQHLFLPYVLDINHVRTMARLFKDFDMMIPELFLHYADGLFWISVLLILPYETLFQFPLIICHFSSRMWMEFPLLMIL